MSEIPDQVVIQGEVSGQIAVGNYINQFQNLNGCNINIMSPDERPKWERASTPIKVRPRPPEIFLDRTAEIGQIETSIRAEKPLAVSGISGIGKTSLLKQLAHSEQVDPFPDGLFSFSAYDLKLEDLLQCLFSAFYDSNIPVKPDRAEIQKALQDVRALVLIDDLQLGRDETQVILDIAPGCMFIIASSKQGLQVTSGTIRLDGLPEEDALRLYEQELGRGLNENERPLVGKVTRQLQGHPEKIRWLAARVREEDEALDGLMAKLEIDQTQSLLLESVQRLSQEEQKILAILTGVEGRSLPRRHISAILAGVPIEQSLGSLTARGLVRSQETAYSVSETVSGVLSQAWAKAAWDKVVIDYFVHWLEQKPSASQLSEVRETLSFLVRKAAGHEMWSAVATLSRGLEPLLIAQGYWQAWNEVLRSTLEASAALGDRALEGWALHQLGSRSLCLGAKEEAIRHLSQALSIRQSIGDQAGAALTQHNLSLIAGAVPLDPGGGTASASKVLLTASAGVVTVAVTGLAVLGAVFFSAPRAPALTLPENQRVQADAAGLAFEWRSVRRAAAYQIQVDDQRDFNSPVLDSTSTATRQAPDMNLEQGIYYWRVRALNRLDRAGDWSDTRRFTISIPPEKVILARPADQFVETRPDQLLLAWENAENSASYIVQVDDNRDFSSPVEESRVPENNHSPAQELDQGVYHWRVRAINPYDTPGEWSDPWSFIVSIAPDTALVLIEPEDGSKLENTTTPAFRWQSVENAAQYRIQVDDSPAFDSPQYDELLAITSIDSIRALDQGVYYWRVQAENAFGAPGEWSNPWTFIISIPPGVPTLLMPENGVIESSTTTPVYEWSRVTAAASYQIQVNAVENFSSPGYDEIVTGNNHRPPMDLDQGIYYWRVRAFNEYDTPGDWSSPERFAISIPPEAPTLVVPARDVILDSTNRPAFSWQGVSNATQYQIQVDDSSSFNSPEYQSTDSNIGHTSRQGLSQGVYSWRVRAFNEYDTPGDWSSTWQFTVSIPPDAPVLVNPENGDRAFAGRNVAFEWQEVSNVVRYQVQVDNNSSFRSPEKDTTLPGDDLLARFSLSTDTYSWRVRAINRYNTPGPWSAPRTLIVVPPLAAPVLVYPENNETVNTSNVPFNWDNVPGASRYRLQVDNNSNFNSPEFNDRITPSHARISSGLVPANLSCGYNEFRYYWRVRAINQYGMGGPWSSVRVFSLGINRIC